MFASISYTMLIVGCLAAANDYRQAWHDELRTAVFRRRDLYGTQSDAAVDAIPPPLPVSCSARGIGMRRFQKFVSLTPRRHTSRR